MHVATRSISAFLIAMALAFGMVGLAGCKGTGSAPGTDSASTNTPALDEKSQDECYGDDLPAIKGQ